MSLSPCLTEGSLVFLVRAFLVHAAETVEFGNRTGRAKQVAVLVAALDHSFDGGLIKDGGLHLRGDKTVPDQRVDLQFVFAQVLSERVGRAFDRSGPDRLVGVLRFFLRLVDVRLRRQVIATVLLLDETPAFGDGVVGDPD